MVEAVPVAVVTGASSGIGLESARALVSEGWRVIGVGRDPGRCAAADAELKAIAKGGEATMLQADLSLMAEVSRLVEEVAALTDRIDVLINNAGGMVKTLELTKEGLETCFAGNHLGPFLLTNRLLPLLRRAAKARPAGSVRIINTSSDGSEMIPGLNFDDLQNLENYSPGAAYCSAKLANVMFARGLALKLATAGILAFSVHPGTVASNFIAHVPESARQHMESLDAISPTQGADTLIWLATTDPGGLNNGGYYAKRTLRTPNPQAQDEEAIHRLWTQSEQLVSATGAGFLPWS
jgi:NAD(P)-dependent dehydrogenase (short-subunit alcohol dehydrogenase family)